MRLSVVRTSVVLLQSRICQCFLYVYTSARLRYLANPRAPRPGTEPGCDSRRRAGTAMTRKVRNPVFRPSSTHHCTLAAGNDVLIDSLPPSLYRSRPGATASAVGQNRKAPFPLARNCLPIEIDSEMFGLHRHRFIAGSLTAITEEQLRGRGGGSFGSRIGGSEMRKSPVFRFARFRDGNEVAKIVEGRLD